MKRSGMGLVRIKTCSDIWVKVCKDTVSKGWIMSRGFARTVGDLRRCKHQGACKQGWCADTTNSRHGGDVEDRTPCGEDAQDFRRTWSTGLFKVRGQPWWRATVLLAGALLFNV